MLAVTHDGSYHSDDVLAAVLLKKLFPIKEIIRTREQQIIDKAEIVFDVGSIYSTESRRFDHHQQPFDETYYGVKLSSAGLIFRDLYQCQNEFQKELLYKNFVQKIDLDDNGVEVNDFSSQIAKMAILQYPFEQAVAFMTDIFDIQEKYAYKQSADYEIVQNAFLERKGIIMTVPGDCQFYDLLPLINKKCEVKFVGQYKDNQWKIRTVEQLGQPFKSLQLLPEEWAGLRNEQLDDVIGINGCVFCHKYRFLAIFNTK